MEVLIMFASLVSEGRTEAFSFEKNVQKTTARDIGIVAFISMDLTD
jgi:hypothetical protein